MLAAPLQQYKLIYTVGNVDMISSLWKKAPRNFQEECLAVSQSWFESSKAPEPDADIENGEVTPSQKEVAATMADLSQESPELEAQGNKLGDSRIRLLRRLGSSP